MALEGMQIGHYRLQRLIGSGGIGEVYLAEDTRIARKVAIKVVRNEADPYPNSETTQDATRLFEREMKAITALDHPNILPLFDFGEESTHKTTLTYMVMPFRTEGSLVDWLHQQSSNTMLAPQEVVHIVRLAAGSLQHAHNRHLMHLDVKPSNFLIRHREDAPRFPDLLLADFGIAKFNTATAAASQSVRGTPAYMAPEQWAGSPTAASDQYALAVMAYQLLTGRTPFQGTMQQVMYQHLQQPPRPASALNPYIPPAVDEVLLRALAKNPGDRFPSIQEFATAFERAWQGERPVVPPSTQYGTVAPPPPPPPHAASFSQAQYTPSFSPPVNATPVPQIQYPPPAPSTVSTPWLKKIGIPQLVVILSLLVVVIVGGIIVALSNHSSPSTTTTGNGPQTTSTPPPTAIPTPTPTTNSLQLHSSYSGTIYDQGTLATPMDIFIDSQDQQGTITAARVVIHGSGATIHLSCTGNVTTDQHLTLNCDNSRHFYGLIDANGHIAGKDETGCPWNVS